MRKTSSILLALFMSAIFANAQGITTHAYRKVAPENMQEYLKRETTYWKKFAEAEVKKGNLTFWGIFQKVGGLDQENDSNILIVNSFNNIDEEINWGGIQDLFPDKTMDEMGTFGISTQKATIFLRDQDNWVEGEGANPEEDFKFVKYNYYNPKSVKTHLDFEKDKWKPMIQKAMNEGKTTMKGWGNSYILHPNSAQFPYKALSYDLFGSFSDALKPVFTEDHDMSDDFFADIKDNSKTPRSIEIYRIVSVVTAPNNGE